MYPFRWHFVRIVALRAVLALSGLALGQARADILIEYVGPPASTGVASNKPLTPPAAVRATIRLVDGALGPNDFFGGSSQLPNGQSSVKSAVITDGVNTFDYKNSSHRFEISLTTNAKREIVKWQLGASSGPPSNSGTAAGFVIALLGPGRTTLAAGTSIAGSQRCMTMDIVRGGQGVSCLPGTWSVKSVGSATPGAFELTSARGAGTSGIEVRYAVRSGDREGPVTLNVFRADSPLRSGKWVKLGQEELSGSDLLPSESERTKVILPNVPLIPNPALPYVVVEAVATEGISTASFRKFLLGVLVHGYNFDLAQAGFEFFGLDAMALSVQLYEEQVMYGDRFIHPWVQSMKDTLVKGYKYDGGVVVDWGFDSTRPLPDLTRQAAGKALSLMQQAATALPGLVAVDSVDWHLIGHSRGSVVVSEVLKLLAKDRRASRRGLEHDGAVHITLLDPHPANNDWAPYMSIDSSGMFGSIGTSAARTIEAYQRQALDPPIEIPGDAGVQQIDVWFQRNLAEGLNDWSRSNLWGQSAEFVQKNNRSSITINAMSLTGKRFDFLICNRLIGGSGITSVRDGLVDHSSVPAIYQQLVFGNQHVDACGRAL